MHIFLVLQLTAFAIQLGFLVAQICTHRSYNYGRSMFYGRACQILLVPNLLFAALYFATK